MSGKAGTIAANDRAGRDDIAYYARRERQERERAVGASDQAVRDVHLSLAAAYRRRLTAEAPFEVPLELVR